MFACVVSRWGVVAIALGLLSISACILSVTVLPVSTRLGGCVSQLVGSKACRQLWMSDSADDTKRSRGTDTIRSQPLTSSSVWRVRRPTETSRCCLP